MRFITTFIYLLFILISVINQVVLAEGTAMLLGGPVEIATDILPFGYRGDEYSTKIYVTGGSGDFMFHPTALPSGLSLKESGRLEGRIESASGKHTLKIIVSDTLNEAELYEKTLTLTVYEKPAFSKQEINPAVNGSDYTQKVGVTGGSGEFIFQAAGLPKGLLLDKSGLISGIPYDTPGKKPVTIVVSDRVAPKKKIEKEFTLALYQPVTITTDLLPPVKKHNYAEMTFKTQGGSGALTFSAKNLPAGLKLSKTGRLSGAVTMPRGDYKFLVTLSDKKAHTSIKKQFQIGVVDFFPDAYEAFNDNDFTSSNNLIPGETHQTHSFHQPGDQDLVKLDLRKVQPGDVIRVAALAKKTEVTPYLTLQSANKTRLETIALPTTENATGFLFVCSKPGFYYITAAEATGETGEYRLSVINNGPKVDFITDNFPDLLKNTGVTLEIKARDGSGNFHFSAENLPKGLSLSNDGILSGSIDRSGDYPVTVTVYDSDWKGVFEKQKLTLKVVDFLPDRFESLTDNDFSTENMLRPGSSDQHHTLNHPQDQDYIKLDLTKTTPGNIIDIQTGRLTQSTNTIITLFSPDKSEILTGTATGNETCSRVLFECKTQGVFYLLVEEADNKVGDYSLSVVDTGPKVKFKTDILPDILKKGNSRFQLKAVDGSGRYFFSAKSLPGNLTISDTGLLTIHNDTGLEKGEYPFSVRVDDPAYPGIATEKMFILTIVDYFPDRYEALTDNGFNTSNLIKPDNLFQYHTFNHKGDIDYLAFDLPETAKGNVIHITTLLNSEPTETVLTLFSDRKKALLCEKKTSNTSYSSLYFKCPAAGRYYLKIEERHHRTGDYGLTLTDRGPAARILTDAIPDALTGKNYSFQIKTKGGSGEFRFKAPGLPKNLSISATGLISGKVTAASGSRPVTIIVNDALYQGTSTHKPMTFNLIDFFPDSFEAEGDNNFFTRNTMTPDGTVQKHTFNFKGDNDYVKLDLTACDPGDLIKIESSRLTQHSKTALTLYNSKYEKMISTATQHKADYAKILFDCKIPDTYYLKMYERTGKVGDYNLSIDNGGQPLKFATKTIPAAESIAQYRTPINIAGGCERYSFLIHKGRLPEGLVLDSESGVISGDNKDWGSFRVTIMVKDKKVPENMAEQEFIIKAYIGEKLRGTRSIVYPFYVDDTLGVDGSSNTATALPSEIKGGTFGNIRYKIIDHNIPEKRFKYKFNRKTAELTLTEPAPMACRHYQNIDITITIEAKDRIHSNNSMTFTYLFPAKCLTY